MRYRVVRKQPNSKLCLVCGLKNPAGLKASFYELEDGRLLAVFTPSEEHQSIRGGCTVASHRRCWMKRSAGPSCWAKTRHYGG